MEKRGNKKFYLITNYELFKKYLLIKKYKLIYINLQLLIIKYPSIRIYLIYLIFKPIIVIKCSKFIWQKVISWSKKRFLKV